MKVGVTKRETNDIHFENGCLIKFYNQDKLVPPSTTIDLLLVDDLYMMKTDILKNLFPQSKRCLIYTIPSKDGILQKFQSSVFNVKHYNWECVPTRDENWVKNEILQTGGVIDFINEYGCGEENDRLKSIIRDYKIDSIL
jgi:hypothetical protein